MNGRLTVFHGTDYASLNHLLAGISLSRCSPLTDFGRGFYTTTQIHQARQWANQRWRRLPLAQQGANHAIVVQYTIDRDQLSGLDHLTFVTDTPDYYDLVSYSRANNLPTHGRISGSPYDVVYGPVSLYPQALTIGSCDQISFHSNACNPHITARSGVERFANFLMAFQEIVMDMIECTTSYPHEAIYWNKVEQALTEVLDINPGVASEIVAELIRKNLEAPPQERLLGYHTEPLDVAAQATGHSVGDKERARYLAMIPLVQRQAAVA